MSKHDIYKLMDRMSTTPAAANYMVRSCAHCSNSA